MKFSCPRRRGRLFVPALALTAVLTLGACTALPPTRPAQWMPPEVLVEPSSFNGVHGLAIDAKGRLLAGSVLGNSLWEVNRQTGAAQVLIAAPEGQADDIAVGPAGALAWTNYLVGALRVRDSDTAPSRVVAKGLPGLNSVDYDRRNGKLYASQVFLGDALWEIDPAGKAAPRLIKKDMGGLNGFEVGPDGMIYGPLWFKGQVVKIDPANGDMKVINSEFKIPAAANLDGKGGLWVIDTNTGELANVSLATGKKTVAAQLSPALDNLAVAPDGTVYVSNMADNSIQAFTPSTGAVKLLTGGKLAVPSGLKVEGDTLWVADVFGFRSVNVKSGAVKDIFRMQASDMEYPFAVGLSASHFALASWFTGTVQLVDRQTLKTTTMVHGLKAPMDALPMADGSLLYIELATGSLVRATGEKFATKTTVASGLEGPVQFVLGQDGAVYVTEAAGRLTRVNLADGSKTVVASGLALPEGVAQTPWGSFIVAESIARRLVEIDVAAGTRRTVAEQLPIGLEPGPGMPPPYVATGVAVGQDGVIYLSADRNNAVYKIRPMR